MRLSISLVILDMVQLLSFMELDVILSRRALLPLRKILINLLQLISIGRIDVVVIRYTLIELHSLSGVLYVRIILDF